MFNLSGSELVFLVLIALVVLGPEKLPDAVRRFSKTYAEVKKMSSGFQSELRSALDEPMREMRETADAIKKAATFDFDAFDPTEPSTAAAPPVAAAAPTEDNAESTELATTELAPGDEPTRPSGPNFHSAVPPQLRASPDVVDTVSPADDDIVHAGDEGTATE